MRRPGPASRSWAATATTRRRSPRPGRSGRPARHPVQRRSPRRGRRQRAPASRCRWRGARPGTRTSRSGSATPSAASCAPSGANLTGAVCVNVLRHPAWGRAQETYGEDPHHVGELGAALTRGLQRHVLACVKHFACNSMENARFTVDIEVDDVALHEVYLPHFRRIVDEGVASVMSAYNSVNGEWCGAEPRAPHRRAARRVGLRGLRHQRLDLRAARRRDVGDGRSRHRDAVPDGAAAAPPRRPRAR